MYSDKMIASDFWLWKNFIQ